MATPFFLEEHNLPTALEFLEFLRPTHSRWGRSWDSPWVFRGHADATWALLPPIYRPDGRAVLQPILAEIAKRARGWSFEEFEALFKDEEQLRRDEQMRIMIDFVCRAAEIDALKRFAELSDELGLTVDEQEKWKIPGFEGPSQATALAQHHGIPTSLLDWTRKPHIAAYFAACDENPASQITVWALDVETASIREDGPLSLRLFQCPRSSHPYMHAQDGVFTWTERRRMTNYLASRGRWPSVLDILEHEHPQSNPPCLRKVTLPRGEVVELRRLLWRERVSRAHLMPTFDNVSWALRHRWRAELEVDQGADLPPGSIWVRPEGPNPLLGEG